MSSSFIPSVQYKKGLLKIKILGELGGVLLFSSSDFSRSVLSNFPKCHAFQIQSSEGNIVPVTAAYVFKLTEDSVPKENHLIQFCFAKLEMNLSGHLSVGTEIIMLFWYGSCKFFCQEKMKLRIYIALSCFCFYHGSIKVILEKVIGRDTKQYCEIPEQKKMCHCFS